MKEGRMRDDGGENWNYLKRAGKVTEAEKLLCLVNNEDGAANFTGFPPKLFTVNIDIKIIW